MALVSELVRWRGLRPRARKGISVQIRAASCGDEAEGVKRAHGKREGRGATPRIAFGALPER